jgi:hypothetical protein
MKKVLAVFILLSVLFNSAGYYIMYELDRYLVRTEVNSLLEHGIFDNALSVFAIYDPPSDPSFRRVDEHEIIYHNNLYDVAREVITGKTVKFYCLHDKKEEKLIAGLKNMHHSKKAQNLLQHLVSIALPVTQESSHPQTIKNLVHPVFTEHFTCHSLSPVSPPPELV